MTQIITISAIAAGGAIGAVCRHLVSGRMLHWLGPNFPYGTMTVNILGSLLMGLLIGILTRYLTPEHGLRAFLAVGLLGGFTTFSAFSLDAVLLMERGEITNMVFYVLGSVLLSIAALFAGLWCIRIMV